MTKMATIQSDTVSDFNSVLLRRRLTKIPEEEVDEVQAAAWKLRLERTGDETHGPT